MKKIFCLLVLIISIFCVRLKTFADESIADITFFGGFTTKSTLLDVLKSFNANPSVTKITFKI